MRVFAVQHVTCDANVIEPFHAIVIACAASIAALAAIPPRFGRPF
jgi:hypothetical protein